MFRLAFAATALLAASPALAQDPLPDPNDQSDNFSIGVGAAIVPDYEGSDDYEFTPFAGIRGRVSGIDFFTRGTYLYVDFVPRGDGPWEFDVGPIAGVRMNRTGKVEDEVIDLLPERDTAIELGGFVGATYHGLTNPYDELSLRVDVLRQRPHHLAAFGIAAEREARGRSRGESTPVPGRQRQQVQAGPVDHPAGPGVGQVADLRDPAAALEQRLVERDHHVGARRFRARHD